ncbi:MAG: GTP-binding protein [Bacteroidales bacterium]|nr:GTP-binding protein [Bacteroidales bacterium]
MSNFHIRNTPILLLTGYLGSGKTTLVNHILTNQKGIRFAVIVNDIGEVNIDARLIQKEGIVSQRDDSLVALQNGCICCTLQMDLVEQINDLIATERFDYIVIEASGICEPEPIARTISTIPYMEEYHTEHGTPRLDCIVTVVDALRMQSEFANGDRLLGSIKSEEDLANLIIQQVEFCNIVLLNKVSEVERTDVDRLRQIIKHLNPAAMIIECDYAQIELNQILDTHFFSYSVTSSTAGWVRQVERLTTEEEDHEAKHHHKHPHEHEHDEHHHHHEHHHHEHEDDEHEHHHHHHHHHHDGEDDEEEYGISTFLYYRRQAFDLDKFDRFVNLHWPKSVIRCKGVCYFSYDKDMSYLFEQAGVQVKFNEAGQWYATMPAHELAYTMACDPGLRHDWDDQYGDRMQKLVFIGQKMDRQAITDALDQCLVD